MKKFLLLFLLLFCGCESHPNTYEPLKFKIGQKSYIKVNSKLAIITDSSQHSQGNIYYIRYSNDLGELQSDRVQEYELEEYKE